VEDLRAVHAHRAALQANTLRATQDLNIALDQGSALASRLRAWIHGQYGSRGDKLIEFGMKPRLKRKPRGKPEKEEGAPRKPTEP
jgi:hypothetical protein